jgi:hypothetical protein
MRSAVAAAVVAVVVAGLGLTVVVAPAVVATVVVARLGLAVMVTSAVVAAMVVSGLCVIPVPAGVVVGRRRDRRGGKRKAADDSDDAGNGHAGQGFLLRDSHRVSLSEVGTLAGVRGPT